MTSFRVPPRLTARRRLRSQRGVIMILVLIALTLLLVGVAATLRSTDSATAVVGNLAFRRDLTNRAEVAISTAKAALNGPLLSSSARQSDSPGLNYSATRLPNATSIGVPAVLLSKMSDWTGTSGYKCLPASCVPDADGVLTRWVIDRQCQGVAGTALPFGTNVCGYLTASQNKGGSGHNPNKPFGPGRALYRISVRVTGPRNTESYVQTTAG